MRACVRACVRVCMHECVGACVNDVHACLRGGKESKWHPSLKKSEPTVGLPRDVLNPYPEFNAPFMTFVLSKLEEQILYCGAINIVTSSQYIASPDGSAVWSVVVSTRWWLLVDHCVLRNWDRILVRAVKGLIYRVGMVSICPLLWQRDVKLQ